MQVLPSMIISPYIKEITMYVVFYYALELFITLGHSPKSRTDGKYSLEERIKVHSCYDA